MCMMLMKCNYIHEGNNVRRVRCGWTVLRCCGHLIASQRVTEISDCIMQSYRPSVHITASEEPYSTYVNWSLLQPMSPQPHSHHIIRLPLGWKNGITRIYIRHVSPYRLSIMLTLKEWAINPSAVADITNPNITLSAYYYSRVYATHIINAGPGDTYGCSVACLLADLRHLHIWERIALLSDLCKWIYN